MTRAAIFTNGDMEDLEFVQTQLLPDDLIVAVDGGLRHVMALGATPAIIIGDLDSAPNELVQLARKRGAEVVCHPTRKDQTDLELALDLVTQRAVSETMIFGSLGGRLDHALANIFLLARETEAPVRITGPDYEVSLIAGHGELVGHSGDTVTLLPMGTEATGIHTTGLEYRLDGENLGHGSSRGVSNVMTHDMATVTVEHGRLLAIRISTHREDGA